MAASLTLRLMLALSATWMVACSGGGGGAAGPSANTVAINYLPATPGYAVGFTFELSPTVGAAPTVFTIVAGKLPPGVAFDTSTGTFSGRPLIAGSSDLTVRAANAETSADVNVSLQVVPPPAARFLYAANFDDDVLSAYRLDAVTGAARNVGLAQTGDEPRALALAPGASHIAVGTRIEGVWLFALDPVHGRPTLVAGSPLQLGSEVRDLAFHPSGAYLYVLATSGATEDLIFQLEFDAASGALTPLTPPAIVAPDNCTSMAIDPLGRGLYVSHASLLRSFTIGPAGALTSAGDRAGGSLALDIAAAPDASAVYALNFSSTDVYRFPIGFSGALKPGAQATDLAGSFPMAIAVTGDGGWLYVGDGAGTLETFAVGADGALAALTPASVSVDGQLRALAANPSGAGAWVSRGTSNDIVSLAGDVAGGLSADLETPVRAHRLPLGLVASPGTTGIELATTHLYALNRDDDNLNQFAVQADGTLAALVPAMVTTGAQPGSVTAHAFIDTLYVANGSDPASAIQTFGLNTSGAATSLQPFPGATASSAMVVGLDGISGQVVLDGTVVPVKISASGLLSAASGTPTTASVTGRPARHPNGRWLYLPDGGVGAVLSYAIDLDSGALTNTGGAQADLGTLAVAVDPTGRFLYAVNDSVGSDRVRGYSIDPALGILSELASSPYDFTDMARDAIDVVVHPSGRSLYVATRDSDTVAGQGSIQAFAINVDPAAGPALGALTALGSPTLFSGQAPGDLEIDAVGARLYVSIEATASSVLVYNLNANGALSDQPTDSEATGAGTHSMTLRERVK